MTAGTILGRAAADQDAAAPWRIDRDERLADGHHLARVGVQPAAFMMVPQATVSRQAIAAEVGWLRRLLGA